MLALEGLHLVEGENNILGILQQVVVLVCRSVTALRTHAILCLGVSLVMLLLRDASLHERLGVAYRSSVACRALTPLRFRQLARLERIVGVLQDCLVLGQSLRRLGESGSRRNPAFCFQLYRLLNCVVVSSQVLRKVRIGCFLHLGGSRLSRTDPDRLEVVFGVRRVFGIGKEVRVA